MHQGKLVSTILFGSLALALATPAWSDEECGVEGPKAACPAGTFQFRLMPQAKSDTACEEKAACIPNDAGIGPAPSFITCEAGKGGYTCEAWPKGDMKYSWALGDGLEAMRGSQPGNSAMTMRCAESGGSTLMSVRVTAPNGLYETVFSQVRCAAAPQSLDENKFSLR